jgi:pimeloyl-ACP methyl ester carboxylesterase
MRAERPGCGDSEGGPLREVDFDTELAGNREALLALKRLDYVDAERVFIFGHSMGGIMAPLLAAQTPVRGIAVFGTASGTWFESVFGQRRRLASLDGTDAAEADREILRQARFWYPLLVERKTPREILEKDSELAKLGWVKDDKYVGDRTYKFHHQLADKSLAEAWSKVAATRLSVGGKEAFPRVLAIWGTSDWLATKDQATWIAEVVNRVQPGQASVATPDSVDHFFNRAASPEESYLIWKAARPGEFHPAFLDTLRGWLDETAGKAKQK